MKKWLVRTVVFAFVLILAGVLLYGLSQSKTNQNKLVLYGNVDVRQVDIGFRVSGQVTQLLYEEGDLVKKGDLLAVLDQTPYNNLAQEALANMNSIKASYENAKKLLKRREELIEDGAVSQEDLDNAIAARDELKANLAQTKAALKVALDNLAYTEVFAPTDGVILTRIREPGTVVKESDPVFTLSVTSPVWIRAFVDEPSLGQIYYGMTAKVKTDTADGPVYTGKIGFISPVAEFTPKTVETSQLRTDLVYRLRIYVDNPDRYLKQGMPVTVTLRKRSNEKLSHHNR
ncbi:MAG: efflux RND transporter periplasmic adaptor subunit [Chlamydiota bacterium]